MALNSEKNNNKVLYFHINKITRDVFYVGIGNKLRAFTRGSNRNKFWNDIVNEYGYDVEIVASGLTTEEANVLEIFWIRTFGRKDKGEGNLVNLTDGGSGGLYRSEASSTMAVNTRRANGSYVMKDKTKELLMEKLKGKKKPPRTEEHKKNISLVKKGKPRSKETVLKVSLGLKRYYENKKKSKNESK